MTVVRSRASTSIACGMTGRFGRAGACIAFAMLTMPGVALPATPIDPNATAPNLAEHVCSECHGPDGAAPAGDVPNLAGQRAEFLRKQLHAFKSHSRSDEAASAHMWPIAHDLGERQIDDLAGYFAAQPAHPQPTEATSAQIAAGHAIFARGAAAQGVPSCAGCHGRDAAGTTDAPRLAGQHTTYLARQLAVFQRSNGRPGARAMRSVSHELTPEAIENVAAYLQALPNIGAR